MKNIWYLHLILKFPLKSMDPRDADPKLGLARSQWPGFPWLQLHPAASWSDDLRGPTLIFWDCLWDVYVNCMGILCDCYGNFMGLFMGFFGIFMGILWIWNLYGFFKWDFMGFTF